MQVSSTSPLGASQPATPAKADLEKAAKAFEAIFMRQMIGAMRSASLDEGLTDTSASLQFRDMADSRTADAMAESGSFGVARLLLQQFGGTSAGTPSPASPNTEETAK